MAASGVRTGAEHPASAEKKEGGKMKSASIGEYLLFVLVRGLPCGRLAITPRNRTHPSPTHKPQHQHYMYDSAFRGLGFSKPF
eukprot:7336257-Prymnesium_polylepis.4